MPLSRVPVERALDIMAVLAAHGVGGQRCPSRLGPGGRGTLSQRTSVDIFVHATHHRDVIRDVWGMCVCLELYVMHAF